MTAEEMVEPFGVAKTTVASKAAEIRKILKIDHFNSEWVLASDIEKNPMLWHVEAHTEGTRPEDRYYTDNNIHV